MTRRREEVSGDADNAPDAKVARVQRVIEQGTFLLDFPQEESVFQQGDHLWGLPEVHQGTATKPRPATEPLRDFSVAMPRLSLKDVDVGRLPQQAKAALDFLVLLNPCEIIPDGMSARQPVLLPQQKPEHQGRRTLVLDLDETLVHCHCQPFAPPGAHPDIHLELENGDPKAVLKAKVFVRPGARQLLLLAAERFEVVVFTASAAIYADKVLDWLDPGRRLISYRLYREACTELAGGHFKDLRRLGRSLDDVVLVDNSPLALGLRPENGMLISSWYGDDDQAFIDELTHQSFAVVAAPARLASPVAAVFAAPQGLLGHSGANGPLVWSFKRQGELKERSQVRRVSFEAGDPEDLLWASFEVMEQLAAEAMDAWCAATMEVPSEAARRSFGDLSFAAEEATHQELGKGKSVLNLYHYFNSPTCDEEPFRSHADPGLLTVLGRSTKAGLQAVRPLTPGKAPGRPASYGEEWLDLELLMDDLGRGQAPHVPFLVLVGETMERLSGGWHPSCVHRVKRSEEPGESRFNMAFELRPRCNVWHPWQKMLDAEVSETAPETEP